MLVNAGDPITGQYTERTEKWKAIAKKAKQDYKQEGFFTDLKFENIQDKLGVNGQWINERMKEEHGLQSSIYIYVFFHGRIILLS